MAGIFCLPNMNKILKIIKFCFSKAKILIIMAILTFNLPIQGVFAAWNVDDVMALINARNNNTSNYFSITGGDSLLVVNMPEMSKTLRVVLTGYSSTPDQTDDTPFITASGSRVRDGVIAANFLAFGTKIKIPELFGDKEFIVEDRMAKKHNGKIDIWFPNRRLAKNFGIQEADVVVLE